MYLIAVVLMPVPGKEAPDFIYSVAASVLTNTLNIVAALYVFSRFAGKPDNVFYKYVLGGMVFRLLFSLSSIFVLIIVLNIPYILLTVNFFLIFFFALSLEIYHYHTYNNKISSGNGDSKQHSNSRYS